MRSEDLILPERLSSIAPNIKHLRGKVTLTLCPEVKPAPIKQPIIVQSTSM